MAAAPKKPASGGQSQRHKDWKPATKSQENMAHAYRGMSPSRRMEIGVQKVVEEGLSQAEAARQVGVSRPRLNEAVKAAKLKLGAQAERSSQALERRRLEAAAQNPADVAVEGSVSAEPRQLRVENESRRIPPFEEFCELYFNNEICPDCGVHHETPEYQREIMRAITGTAKRLLVQLPPYHSKSTIVSVKHTIYDLCRDPNSRTAIISKSERLAQEFIQSIQQYLEDHDTYETAHRNLIDDYGPFRSASSTWNKTKFYIAGRQSVQAQPSVAAYGVGGHIYGTRWDTMKFDDIADLDNQKNPELVQQQLKWCTQIAGNRVGRTGRQLYVGTRISAGDIYSYLDDLPAFEVLRFPCILDEIEQTTLWQDHFPYSAAADMRGTMTPEGWQLVYQNVDVPGLGADFPLEVLEHCFDDSSIFGQADSTWALVGGLDPAGAGKQAGVTALVLLAVDLVTGERHLVDIVAVRSMKAPQLKDQMFAWADAYPNLREFRVEVNGLQGQLTQYNDELLRHMTNRGVRIVPHITTGHNKWDPEFGVQSLAPMFYNRQIKLPTGNNLSRQKLQILLDQLTQFPMGVASDVVMALWFAELGARELFKRTTLPMFNERQRVPAHVRRRRRIVDFANRSVRTPDKDHYSGRPTGHRPDGREVRLVNTGGSITLYGTERELYERALTPVGGGE